MIEATIDGTTALFPEGLTILDAASRLGTEIPTLCADPRLKPSGSCRLCLVRDKNSGRQLASCMSELTAGMDVETNTPEILATRKMNLQMLAMVYPPEPFVEFPDKPFHRLAKDHGLSERDFHGTSSPSLKDNSHPYIRVDMSQCIKCFRCVRICDEVQGQFVWQITDRGNATQVRPDGGGGLNDSSCVSCGACVDTCPTGALEDASVHDRGAPTTWTRTVCPYCGTGCEMEVGTAGDRIVQVRPALSAPVNKGHLCVKGRYAFDFVDANERITEPMIKTGDKWEIVSWDDALRYTGDRFAAIVSEHGPDSVGVLGSARATNEENYLAQKFARIVLGTNNVDCCARVCHAPSAAAMKMMLGTGSATNSFDDVELAKTILICGANPTENHPIVGARIKEAVLRRGTKLIVIDPRRIELTRFANIHLAARPGTNVLLLNAIANVIVEEQLFDESYISERVLEFVDYAAFVGSYPPEAVAQRCGVDAGLIRQAARLYAESSPAMCFHGLGVTEHIQGTEGVMCLINLALLTGNIGKKGSGINPLRGQNNVQGAAHMGCDPGILAGSIAIEDGRALTEEVWKARVPGQKGLNLLQMLDATRDGRFKALWSIGYDVYLTNANAHETERAMRSLELVVVQDMFLNETAREFGHVFLPAASSFEKDGTFMNAERRVQRVRKAIGPRGNSKTDSDIICSLARVMGKGSFFEYGSAKDVWDEVRTVWSGAKGITYDRIDRQGLQWPCLTEDDPGAAILHMTNFGGNPKTKLRRIKFRPTPETVSDEFPFLLNTGRSLYQFNAGTMTDRTLNSELRPSDLLMLNPRDAEQLLINDGDAVRLVSRYGDAIVPVQITSAVREGEPFSTFHTASIFLNRITTEKRDRFVYSPEYKVTAVRIEKLNYT